MKSCCKEQLKLWSMNFLVQYLLYYRKWYSELHTNTFIFLISNFLSEKSMYSYSWFCFEKFCMQVMISIVSCYKLPSGPWAIARRSFFPLHFHCISKRKPEDLFSRCLAIREMSSEFSSPPLFSHYLLLFSN